MGRGKAFSVGGAAPPDAAPPIQIFKGWQHLDGGRKFLVEELPYSRIKPQLDLLAASDGPKPLLAATRPGAPQPNPVGTRSTASLYSPTLRLGTRWNASLPK